ncbi:MAG: helix-turn-helix transcriptional regulator [Acidobacteria bacterium]|nr:helix-turn-helix transcriptional regulator [Acidobacteriota bacterium]MBV9478806.1 helix-turn-helix transcriptional regulator [Acidobacteriota bacterium]
MVGEKLRSIRLGQKRSLADVAGEANISVATLSRIENDKQTLDIAMFLMLARVLEVLPHELLGDLGGNGDGDGVDPLVRKIAGFDGHARTALWRALADASRRAQTDRPRRARLREISEYVEELLAQLEFVREELDAVRRRLRER